MTRKKYRATLSGAIIGLYWLRMGTHALYAYEATAGVRLDSDMLATRKRILFSTQLAKVDSCMLRA